MILKTLSQLACFAGCAFVAGAAEANKLFEALQPSIVLISSPEGIGSGFVISQDGLILTNLHVVSTPLPLSVTVTVEQHGKRETRKLEGIRLHKVHDQSDIALLKLDVPDCRFIPVRLSRSVTDCKAGDTCFALGFPFLPGQTRSDLTITKGLINSTKREIEGKSYLQIDAAIMPGNSGGALVNADGMVVGIPTLRYEGADRVGLAIPVAGINMKDFSAPGNRKGNAAEAERLEKMASAYLARDIFSYGRDPESAVAALQLLREAQSLDPTNAHRSYMVAETYRRLGMLQPARAYAEIAARLDPTNFDIRISLATICNELHDDDAALNHYVACVPLIDSEAGDSQKAELFRKVISLLEKRKEALRTLYLLSWSKAILGGSFSIEEQLQIKRVAKVVPESLVRSILDMKSGHSIAEMRKLAAENPQLIPEMAPGDLPPADISKVKEETVENAVIISKVNIAKGDSARLADAPSGMVYHAEKGVLEWTPPPFSADAEIRVLFIITHPDGKEETLIHTVKREP